MSGLMPWRVVAADSTLAAPMRESVWAIWRWRLVTSTMSSSISLMVPHPGGGEVHRDRGAEAPGADHRDRGVEEPALAALADLGQQ
jgi:hypothetical protein